MRGNREKEEVPGKKDMTTAKTWSIGGAGVPGRSFEKNKVVPENIEKRQPPEPL